MNADPETFLPIYKEELFINDNLVKTAIYNVHHLCDEKCSNEVLFQHFKRSVAVNREIADAAMEHNQPLSSSIYEEEIEIE